jgi:hypothetical protein
MTVRRPSAVAATLLSLTLLLSVGITALDAPKLSFGDEYPEVARKSVRAVLNGEGSLFLGGAELNGMTSLRYQGNTGALNRFLSGLANCLDVTMQVSFTGELDQDTDWRVFHEPHENRFHIEIDY